MNQRIQRKRTKGWKLPENTTCVGRGTKWGNPYRIEKAGLDKRYLSPRLRERIENGPSNSHIYSRRNAVKSFEISLRAGDLSFTEEDVRRELKGKNLACWCSLDEECHADILLEIANG